MADIRLGSWSTTLLLASLHGLAMAVLLTSQTANRQANRCLAALLLVVVLLITPYTIGYAGFYDAWPWLTYAPFFWQLALGPLIWLYVRQLGERAMPPRWRWHFLPAALQGGYFCVLFVLPLQAKWDWDEAVHAAWVAPALDALVLVSLAFYWVKAWQAYVAYQQWLEQHSGAREEYRLGWLRGFLWAIAAVILVTLGYTVTDRLILDLDYFDHYPLYLMLAALVYYLGVEGWRHAVDAYPVRESQPLESLPVEQALIERVPNGPERIETEQGVESPERDWAALGREHARVVSERGWWREPDLDLATLARRLGTNTLYLSRALNDGLGQSFSEFINRQRVEAARTLLTGHAGMLEIAAEVGFGSKASFNRAFRAYAGCTPTAYRQQAQAARITS